MGMPPYDLNNFRRHGYAALRTMTIRTPPVGLERS